MTDFIREVKKEASGQWMRLLPELAPVDAGNLTGKHGPCPMCGGKDRFRAFNDFEVTGGTTCNQCGHFPDGISTLAWLNGIGQGDSAKLIAGHLGLDRRNGHAGPISVRTADGAGVELRDRAYRAILEECRLSDEDRAGLQQRGLDDATIDRIGYGSIEPSQGREAAQRVLTRTGLTEDELCRVPGVVRKNGTPTLTAWLGPGLLIPCLDGDGHIQALKVRRRHPVDGQPRYLSLSGGKNHDQNAGAHCHVSLGNPSTSTTVRVTEGELKADIASALSQLPTISVPGINQWRLAIPVLKRLGAKHVLVSYDALEFQDENKPTAREAVAFARELLTQGFEVEIETWHPEDGKGIDDVIANGGETSAMELDGLLSLRPDLNVGDESGSNEEPLMPVSVGTLIKQYPTLKPPVVEGLLRQGEVANIIAASKVGKSWLAYGVALSVATGRPWLDTFDTVAGQVLLIDNELHSETIANRIPKVAGALFIPAREYEDCIDILSLRGRLTDYHGLRRAIDQVKSREYRLIIVDAHYRMLPSGFSENENASMAAIYNLLDSYAAKTGAAWVLIHHTSKGAQGDKSVTDVGAGAGSQSRAADAHLVLRDHQQPDHAVLDAALRSWQRIEPITLQWDFPLWRPVDVDPAKLKGNLTRGEQKQAEKDRDGKNKICDTLAERIGATNKELQEATGISRERLTRLLCQMMADGELTSTSVLRRGNSCELFNLATTPLIDDVGDQQSPS